jgi:predicted TIM-barrel fold metal-dependent hydrolase
VIIDAHTHLGLESFIVKPIPDWKRLKPAFQVKMEMTPERLIQSMDESGISRSVVFPFPLEEMDSRQANSYVLEQSRRFPNRFIPFALLDEEPEHWVERGCFGFKQHFLLAPERFNAKKVYRSIEESGFPLVAHFSTGHALAEARAILNIAPSLKMIVAHMGRQVPNTGDGVLALVRELKSETTVCFETSTVHNSEIIREAAEIAGPERILFGSDFPFNTDTQAESVGYEINMIRNAFSDEVTREMVFRTNVLKMTGEA